MTNHSQDSFIRHGLDQRQCETEALVQIIAGSDTTATTIRCGMLYLMSTPLAYRALQAEIDEGIKAGTVSNPVTNAEANEMPYLQVGLPLIPKPPSTRPLRRVSADLHPQKAVILETLRLHPPFTGLAFKKVPPEGDIIDGKPVPGGTLVGPNFWATGRNTAVFGADADVFRPARWLEVTDVEQHAEMRRVAELVFGYGRWGCAGKMIALLEMNKVFVEVSSLLALFCFSSQQSRDGGTDGPCAAAATVRLPARVSWPAVEKRQLRAVFAEGHVGFGFVAGGSVRVGRDGLCNVEVVPRRQSCGVVVPDEIVVWTRISWLGIHQFSSRHFCVPQDHPCGFPLRASIVSGRTVQRTRVLNRQWGPR